jgi:hypothetical protein
MVPRVRRKPEWVQAILLGMGTLIGATTFWWTDIHAPAVSPATLTISPTLEAIGRRGDELLVRAALKVQNRSAFRVYVPAFWYTVRGFCYHPRALSPDSYEVALSRWSEGGMQSRFNDPTHGELLVAGRPSPRKDTYFDPGSDRQYEELFLVPASHYGALRMEVHYMVAKDITGVDSTHWRVVDHEVGEQVFIATRGAPIPGAAFIGARGGSEPYSKRKFPEWSERAGAAWGWSHASLSLWPAPGAAAPPPRADTAACAG